MNLSRLLVTPVVCPFEICIRADNLLLFAGKPSSAVIDLSKATGLRGVTFLCGREGAEWVATMLRSVTSNHSDLRQITLFLPDMYFGPTLPRGVLDGLGEALLSPWLELDRVLAQLWESHSIRPTVFHYEPRQPSGGFGGTSGSCVHEVLPEITRRGTADLVTQW